MEEKCYTCQYCKKDFVPKRRKVQKFCSNSCRVSFHRFKNVGLAIKSTEVQIKDEKQEPSKIKVEQISAAGVVNATIGTTLFEIGKRVLTSEENMPATKGDLAKLAANLKRYYKINNLSPNLLGQIPHFDIIKGEVVYY